MSTSQTAAQSATITYNIDPTHSSAHFKVRHLMIAWVRGEFTKVSGTITFHETDHTASSVTAEIDVSTISTREPDRDKHDVHVRHQDRAERRAQPERDAREDQHGRLHDQRHDIAQHPPG